MTSEQLAQYFEEFMRECQGRILGVGHEQYAVGDIQRFEVMPLTELIDEAQQELMDSAVYAAMLSIRLERIRTAVLGPANPMFEKAPS